MSKIIIYIFIKVIKAYKYFISPLLGSNCRFLPTCSDYFCEALKKHGLKKGLSIGLIRIFSCHPIKFLGGRSGLDFVPEKRSGKNGQ